MSYIGNTNTTQAFTPAIDYFSGNGSTTAFTLSRPIASVAQVQVVVNNVAQNPSSAFTVSGNTITFTSAPSSGTNNIYVYYTSPITQVIAPGQGTVAPTQVDASYALWNKSGSNINYTAGNVGIGTSSPVTKLHTATSGNTPIIAETTGGATSYLNLRNTGGQAYIAANNNALVFAVTANATEAARIDSSGNVGIGTSSPTAPLDVKVGTGNFTVGLQGPGNALLTASATMQLDAAGASSAMVFKVTGTERGRFDSSGNLQFNSGYGSVATAYGCRAWVNFNGTGTVAIRASGNVTSITDNGTGNYTVNFSTAMTDANYCVTGTASRAPLAAPRIVAGSTTVPATGSVRIQSGDDGGTANDCEFVNIAIFR